MSKYYNFSLNLESTINDSTHTVNKELNFNIIFGSPFFKHSAYEYFTNPAYQRNGSSFSDSVKPNTVDLLLQEKFNNDIILILINNDNIGINNYTIDTFNIKHNGQNLNKLNIKKIETNNHYKIYLKVDPLNLDINSKFYTENLTIHNTTDSTVIKVEESNEKNNINAFLGSNILANNVLETIAVNSMSDDLLMFSIKVKGYTNLGDVWFYVDPQIDSNIGFTNNKYVTNCSYRKNVKDFELSTKKEKKYNKCSDVPGYSCCFFYEEKDNKKIKCIPSQPNIIGKSECKSYEDNDLGNFVGKRKHAYYSKTDGGSKSPDFIDVCDNMIINPDATISGHWATWKGLRKALNNGILIKR